MEPSMSVNIKVRVLVDCFSMFASRRGLERFCATCSCGWIAPPTFVRDRCQSSSRTSRSPSLSATSSSYVTRPTNSPSRSGATADVCSIKT